MRLNAQINDNLDLVNKQYITDTLANLDATTLQLIRNAIDSLEQHSQWGSFSNEYAAADSAGLAQILNSADYIEDSTITMQSDIAEAVTIAHTVTLLGAKAGVPQGYAQEVT